MNANPFASATEVIGRRLVTLLVSEGHEVAGTTRSADRVKHIVELGAEAIVCDVFDITNLLTSVSNSKPDVIWHQLTDLPDDPVLIAEFGPANNCTRREATAKLLKVAAKAGARQFIAQSVAWQLPGNGDRAASYLESAVDAAGGVVN